MGCCDAPNGWSSSPGCANAAAHGGRTATSLSPALWAGTGICYRLISTYSLGLVLEAFVRNSKEMNATAGVIRAGRRQEGIQLGDFSWDSGSMPLNSTFC